MTAEKTLTREEASRFYDRFGAKQDSQGWYEDPATQVLERHASLEEARAIAEFGCGTGRLASRLLSERALLASYLGVDSSATMCSLAEAKLAPLGARASIRRGDGSPVLPVADGAVDRVLTTYVLDLLSSEDIAIFLGDARRALAPGGLLLCVGLTPGERGVSRLVSRLWSAIHRRSPQRVGGCRPLAVATLLPADAWSVVHREVVVSWGLASEVLVASRR